MSMGSLAKDPSDIPVFSCDWTQRLATGETLATSSWVVASGLTNVADSILAGNLKTAIKLSGGTAGQKYVCTNTVTTSAGQTLQRSGIVQVNDL